jgi:hypothetical protein
MMAGQVQEAVMEKEIVGPELPYVARTYWFIRWPLLLTWIAVFSAYLIFSHPETSFRVSNFFDVGFYLLFLVLFPAASISMFLSRTTFFEDRIEHTSQLLIKSTFRYGDIQKVEYGSTGHLRITFAKEKRIKIWSGQADLNKVMTILTFCVAPTTAGWKSRLD